VAAWLGAAFLTAAVVAPAAFAVLPTRALAGALVGRVLSVLFPAGAVLAALGWWVARNDDRRRALIHGASAVWLAAMIAAQFGVAPGIQRIRESAGGAIDALPVDDLKRVRFGQLHAVSVGLLGVGMVAALIVVMAGSRIERRPQE
jgi:uncharacterized membrane protein YiaA